MMKITNLKNVQNTLTQSNVAIEHEYLEINNDVFQEKLKLYLKLWFFRLGGGKVSLKKSEQLDALRQFNLTKEGIDNCISQCMKQFNDWKIDYKELVNNEFNNDSCENHQDHEVIKAYAELNNLKHL